MQVADDKAPFPYLCILVNDCVGLVSSVGRAQGLFNAMTERSAVWVLARAVCLINFNCKYYILYIILVPHFAQQSENKTNAKWVNKLHCMCFNCLQYVNAIHEQHMTNVWQYLTIVDILYVLSLVCYRALYYPAGTEHGYNVATTWQPIWHVATMWQLAGSRYWLFCTQWFRVYFYITEFRAQHVYS